MIFVEIDPDLLDQLSAYAIHTRYSGDYPTLEEAKQALSITKVVRKFALDWFLHKEETVNSISKVVSFSDGEHFLLTHQFNPTD